MVSLLPPNDIEDLLWEEKVSLDEFKYLLKKGFESEASHLEREYGKNWSSKIKVLNVHETEYVIYAEVDLLDYVETIYLVKNKGKYYIDVFNSF